MNVAARILFRAGAESSLVEDFRALADATAPDGAPRYRERPVLEDLARFLVGMTGGPNRDAAFYELCHLVGAVDAAGAASDRRNAFFLASEAATMHRFRFRLDEALSHGGWRRPGVSRTPEGIVMSYPESAFTVRFARIPFLAALYEFLCGMDDFSFYAELQGIFDEMGCAPADVKTVQAASNRIAARFRRYRRGHVAPARQDGKFDLLLSFLMGRSPPGRLAVDDAAVFDFWCTSSASGEFRAYRTVFDAFANFLRALDEMARADAISRAASIGTDRARGEVEPAAVDIDLPGEWVSPLALLDHEPAADIKFFKKESERKPIEMLMHYGPAAIRLPLAFLRLESFGPVQSAITTDLQVRRGQAQVQARIACADAASYRSIVTVHEDILALIGRLQKAAFHVLHHAGGGETRVELSGVPGMTAVAAEAARTFRGMSRKGFDEAGLANEARIEGFRLGAEALVTAAEQLKRYLAAARRMTSGGHDLDSRFDADRCAFSARFGILYGVSR